MSIKHSQKQKIVIAGNFQFPDGNAAGKRVAGLGFIFRDLGFKPVFIGISPEGGQAARGGMTKLYKGYNMPCYPLPYPRSTKDWMDYRSQFRRTEDILEKIGIESIAIVVLYGSPAISLWMSAVSRFARKHGILVISDCVDWIQFSNKGFALNLAKYIDTNYQKRVVIPRSDGVITVSKYLFDYYSKRGCNTVLLPPVTDTELKPRAEFHDKMGAESSRMRLCYAGMPFDSHVSACQKRYKDRLDRTIELLSKVLEAEGDFVFDIFGLTALEYLAAFPAHVTILEKLDDHVIFHGKVTNTVVREYISKSDFSVLQRDDTLVTRAGFPTKISESISLGVPVITEKTSNITDYIVDGINGFFLDGKDDRRKFIEILHLDDSKLAEMKKSCRESKVFDYRSYLDTLNGLVDRMDQ